MRYVYSFYYRILVHLAHALLRRLPPELRCCQHAHDPRLPTQIAGRYGFVNFVLCSLVQF